MVVEVLAKVVGAPTMIVGVLVRSSELRWARSVAVEMIGEAKQPPIVIKK